MAKRRLPLRLGVTTPDVRVPAVLTEPVMVAELTFVFTALLYSSTVMIAE